MLKSGYSASQIEQIKNHVLKHGSVRGSGLRKEHYNIFACAVGDEVISWDAHLAMMAVIQPFISGAISKTVNLPADVDSKEISKIYISAWERGLKSIAVYRNNSKGSQPLNEKISTSTHMICPDCGKETQLIGGCFRCVNCGTTIGCA